MTGVAHALAVLGIMGAVAYIDVSLAILIVFLHPFLIAIVEHFRGESRLTPALVARIAVAVVGLGLALAVKLDALDPLGVGLASARPPAFLMIATVSSERSGDRSATTTRAPSRAMISAPPRPMPEPAPVTIATRSSSIIR